MIIYFAGVRTSCTIFRALPAAVRSQAVAGESPPTKRGRSKPKILGTDSATKIMVLYFILNLTYVFWTHRVFSL
jgi:hypothetical protein